jgi:hypothetical protein
MKTDLTEFGGKNIFRNIYPSQIKDILQVEVRQIRENGKIPSPYMFIGGSGIGKTWNIERLKYYIDQTEVIKLHLTNMSSEVLFGIPYYTDNGEFENIPYKNIKYILEMAKNNPANIYFVELEEANRADQDMINKLFQLVGGRRYNDIKIPNNIIFIMDINPSESRFDNLASFDDAFYRRFIVFYTELNYNDWLDHARSKDPESIKYNKIGEPIAGTERLNIHPIITKFINDGRYQFLNYLPNGGDYYNVVITPANWGNVSDYLYNSNKEELLSPIGKIMIHGLLREEVGNIFYGFLRDELQSEIGISAQEIISDYENIRSEVYKLINDNKNDKLTELTSRVIDLLVNKDNIDKNEIENFATYLLELPKEIVIYSLKTSSSNKPKIIRIFSKIEDKDIMQKIKRKLTEQEVSE